MKYTAWAPANIAFIKYWGKLDDERRLPTNPSISMNLSGSFTVTTVEFDSTLSCDAISLQGGEFSDAETRKVAEHLNRIRSRADIHSFARVETKNTFPKGAGAAASASGFAALTLAACAASGIVMDTKGLSSLARLGSGSACRSIPDGFVRWDSEYAYSLHPEGYWDIRDALVVVDSRMKKIPTSDGMRTAHTSPLFSRRLHDLPERIDRLIRAVDAKDFSAFGQLTEEDCLDMHAVMRSQVPALEYWNDRTRSIIESIHRFREQSVAVYYTIDAGPNVHVLYEGINEKPVLKFIERLHGVETIIRNQPSKGAHLTDKHLF